MKSFIDAAIVHQHLLALGHDSVTLQETSSLLRNLGFEIEIKDASSDDKSYTKSDCKRNNARKLSKKGKTTTDNDCLASLVNRLDALEQRLGAISLPDDADSDKSETTTETIRTPADTSSSDTSNSSIPPPCCILGDHVQQLQDYALGIWPSVTRNQSTSHSISEECSAHTFSSDESEEREMPATKDKRCFKSNDSIQNTTRHQKQMMGNGRRTDPVARYQELQRIWARDPFLSSGGDCRITRRKIEGFKDAFTILHTANNNNTLNNKKHPHA